MVVLARRIARVLALLPLCFVFPSAADACRLPPEGGQAKCHLDLERQVVRRGRQFSFTFTLTNVDTTPPLPPPHFDDLSWTLTPRASADTFEKCIGQDPGGGNRLPVDPTEVTVELDEAGSPFADEPHTHVQEFVATPDSGGDEISYSISVQACSADLNGDGFPCDRRCNANACLEVLEDIEGQAYAEFVEPVQRGAGGASLPFALRVVRNGYDPRAPLRVTVTPENPGTDKEDLFRIRPAEIADQGVLVTGDEEIVEFTCDLPVPCYAGISNVYHVSIADENTGTEIWTSRWHRWQGIARALVDRAPLAVQQLLEVRDEDGDGMLSACEEGEIEVRLIARNPWYDADFNDVVLETEVPEGLVLKSWSLHHHDNPMDAVDPTPAELEALGTLTETATGVRIEAPLVQSREILRPEGAAVFRDLFEVDLVFETPPGGLGSGDDLLFPGLRVTGTAEGIARDETTEALVVPVVPVEVSRIGTEEPLRVLPDKATLAWEEAAVSGATAFNLYRGRVSELGGGFGSCLVGGLADNRHEDAALPGADGLWFYLVTGQACGSLESPLGYGRAADGSMLPRVNSAPCN